MGIGKRQIGLQTVAVLAQDLLALRTGHVHVDVLFRKPILWIE